MLFFTKGIIIGEWIRCNTLQQKQRQFFYKKPQPFTKWATPDILSYALGATLYMPASMPNIVGLIQSQKI
ncbi:HpcH/HpaI aldolase/citrate lyase family protein [Lysinibacillus sp. MHQ-1]|nr:HpcH/HpaI aldolase/citrate lyase family protein [Lysinibacillus sp. MHQ-1]